MTGPQANVATVRRYYEALARGTIGEELERFYATDVVQEEFPNRFLPNGARRDLQGLREAAARGRGVMASQEFELLHVVAEGDRVVVEARWAGTLAIPIGPLAPGAIMRARFAQFFEFRDGKIVAQRNYDCFEPW